MATHPLDSLDSLNSQPAAKRSRNGGLAAEEVPATAPPTQDCFESLSAFSGAVQCITHENLDATLAIRGQLFFPLDATDCTDFRARIEALRKVALAPRPLPSNRPAQPSDWAVRPEYRLASLLRFAAAMHYECPHFCKIHSQVIDLAHDVAAYIPNVNPWDSEMPRFYRKQPMPRFCRNDPVFTGKACRRAFTQVSPPPSLSFSLSFAS